MITPSILQEVLSLADTPSQEHGNLVIRFKVDALQELTRAMLKNSQILCSSLIDVVCVDYPGAVERFALCYIFLSLQHNSRILCKTSITPDTVVDSLSHIVPAATWYEREIFDLYGVQFNHQTSMKRLLMDDDFEGHPMRKDFPLTGHVEVQYDIETKRVEKKPVFLEQQYRTFDTLSPWEGTKYITEVDEG